MRRSALAALLLTAFLTGCGTLRVELDLGTTPTITGSEGVPATAVPPAVETFPADMPGATLSPTDAGSPTPTATPPAVRAVDVTAGKSHSCALLSTGRVKCWGTNTYRQLGNESMVNSNFPVEVEGLADAVALTAGWAHTCALTAAGGVKCWGYNKNGELGNGQTVDSGSPVDVAGLSAGVIAIDGGDDHTCAVTDQGAVKCWGFNHYGQLGDGSTTSRGVPVPIQGPMGAGVREVAAGWGHTCIVTEEKNVQCWGNNEYGQLGYGPIEDYRFTRMDVAGLDLIAERISADGGQSCVLTIYGGIRCWGNNRYGQLGDGSTEVRSTPVTVTGLAQGMRSVAAGWNHTCAITVNGGLLCWGWNYFGQLGDGTKASRATPAGVYGLAEGVMALSLGWAHTCAVTDLGSVMCWGANESGQLGDGTSLDSQAPVMVTGMGGGPSVSKEGTPTSNELPHTPTKTGASPTSTATKK
jgi:alpha-tubulin suppressor-like RCC1 family protein